MASLVFVCLGNICRSPMGERVAISMAAERGLTIEVTSFGISAEQSGNPIDARAAKVLHRGGYDAVGHRARKIGRADIEAADLVVAVEPYQIDKLKKMAPGAENIVLLNDFNPDLSKGTPLADPWFGGDDGFLDTLADVEAAIPGILDHFKA